MRNKLKYIAFITLLFTTGRNLSAQDVVMSQYFSAPLQLNPALAGVSYGPRATLNYRNQWSGLGNGFNGGFTTYMAGFDMHISPLHAGIGVQFTGDLVGNNMYGSYKASIIYAQQIKLNKKMALKIGVQGSYIHTTLRWDKLLWSDMIDPLSGFFNNVNVPNPTSEPPPDKLATDKGDLGAGVLFFTEKLYLGFSVNNLLMHRQSFYEADDVMTPMNFNVHFGANLPIRHKKDLRYNIWVSPNVLFVNQGKSFQTQGTFLTGISFVYFGLGYRNAFKNSDAVIGYLGFKKGKFRIGYSYDYTISRLMGRSGGTHELSFTFNWTGDDNSINPKKNKAFVPCPSILNF
ncbi:MAG: PorP/SprF family type IX secretion system membrane protein [Bacteroidetes bacterium]|nr:PorP/SprF family type IX secretion system membrane protein [Bacteroidota bacterium]